jgi:hypothetical protein
MQVMPCGLLRNSDPSGTGPVLPDQGSSVYDFRVLDRLIIYPGVSSVESYISGQGFTCARSPDGVTSGFRPTF